MRKFVLVIEVFYRITFWTEKSVFLFISIENASHVYNYNQKYNYFLIIKFDETFFLYFNSIEILNKYL